MQVVIDNGYVMSYAIIGDIEGGINISDPNNLPHFEEHYQAYKIVNDELVFDEIKYSQIERESIQNELREQRQIECFSIIDRSKFWYDSLTQEQMSELYEWYEAWLNVTETLQIPEKPDWL